MSIIKYGDSQPISQIIQSSDLDPVQTNEVLEQAKQELIDQEEQEKLAKETN